jgi:hypothetical protein
MCMAKRLHHLSELSDIAWQRNEFYEHERDKYDLVGGVMSPFGLLYASMFEGEESLVDCIGDGLEFAGEFGSMASLPELIGARISSFKPGDKYSTYLLRGHSPTPQPVRYTSFRPRYFSSLPITSSTEELRGVTSAGNEVYVVVHGMGLLASLAKMGTLTDSDAGFTFSESDFHNFLEGKLPCGKDIPVYSYNEWNQALIGNYAVVMDMPTSISEDITLSALADNPVFQMRVGGQGVAAASLPFLRKQIISSKRVENTAKNPNKYHHRNMPDYVLKHTYRQNSGLDHLPFLGDSSIENFGGTFLDLFEDGSFLNLGLRGITRKYSSFNGRMLVYGDEEIKALASDEVPDFESVVSPAVFGLFKNDLDRILLEEPSIENYQEIVSHLDNFIPSANRKKAMKKMGAFYASLI